jgi:hypothetical protein
VEIGTTEPQQALVVLLLGWDRGLFEVLLAEMARDVQQTHRVTRIAKGKNSRRHAPGLKTVPCTFRYPNAPASIQPGVSASQKRRKRASDSPETHLGSHRR